MTKDERKIISPENLKKAFEKAGLNSWGQQAKIAEMFDVTAQAVSRWFNPDLESQPSLDKLIKIADMADMSLDELVLGKNSAKGNFFFVPLLDIESAIIYCQTNELNSEIEERIPVFGEIEHGFAIRNPDNSMFGLAAKSYPKDSILVFNLAKEEIEPEDLVFAIVEEHDENTAVFRKYIKYGSKEHLIAINQSYPPIHDDFSIYAVLEYAILS